jgi:hypothetical protein
VKKESLRITNRFASNPNCKERATIRVARNVILNAPYLFNGRLWDVKSKSMGAGVYELSIKEYTS